MDSITRDVAEYASGASYETLDEVCVHAATQRLVDTLGCALGAWDCGPAQIGRRLGAREAAGKYRGRVMCSGEMLPAEAAAFVNTAMIRNLDFNDRYPGGHPSDCLGALLGLAGVIRVDGRRFLASMTVAYEIFVRLADSAQLSRRGWDQGFGVAIATAAAVCNLLHLPLESTAHAIGIAASSSVPLRVTRSGELTPWKNAATAFAARNGLFAALLATEGMTGPGHAFEGRDGLFDNVTGPFTLEPFPDKGGTALVPRIQLKYWPVEANGQAVVWATLDLRDKIKPDDLNAIEFFTSKFTWFEIGSEPAKWDPQTKETADHSLPYIFARTLVDGPIREASFAKNAILDPSLRPLMAKVKVTVDDAIEALLPKVKVRAVATLNDGRQVIVENKNPLGHPDNPMRDEHIGEKFMAQAEPIIGHERSATALARWWDVRNADDLLPLLTLLDVPQT